ncbi:ABC transporter ATP-binding protein [Falsirhodobacter sp. alg1]|uniref:ABC transporter ATP-binding protein n=1 Tax=Falsirhodobacter sp. alg1 TaxID=1472418 RepID=UPI0005EE68C8|nr:ABC transporter ATP-binding protein [Falsirhodobacter sp. alg1]
MKHDIIAEPGILEVSNLHVAFGRPKDRVSVVNGVDFSLAKGEVLGILGESGSGKSVMLRSLMGLFPRRTHVTGHVRLAGQDLLAMDKKTLRNIRGRDVSMIFQEPMTSFDPVFTVGRQITETIRRHDGVSEQDAQARALELFELVAIPSAKSRLTNYPHEMSGGMRQRVMIALALACRPKVLLADEPTTALDVTVQIQILLLLRELQREMGMSVVFVTHDIGVAAEVADRIGVMYAGRFAELAPTRAAILTPRHPYTRGLLAATIHGQQRGDHIETIPGAPPNLAHLPTGCAFAPRCGRSVAACTEKMPEMTVFGKTHMARCYNPEPSQI